MKLFFAPRTRAVRARWLLEELEVPYELVKVDPAQGEHRPPELVDGALTLTDSSAICFYLTDRFPQKQLAPPPGSTERGLHYQWLLFAEVTLEPEIMPFYRQEQPEPHRARLDELLQRVDRALEGREVLVGDRFSAADVVMASLLHLANHLKLLEGHPRLVEYVKRHTQRPASRRAVAP